MFVKIAKDQSVTLEDRDNFRAFKVVAEGSAAAPDMARRALAGLADLVDTDTAWVRQAALRSRPEVAQDEAWQQAFSAMIEKARPHGWIDDARQAIKAHVEWLDGA